MAIIEGAARRTYSTPTTPTGTTLANIAPKGAMLMDESTGILYANTGTLASPVWTKVGAQT